MSKTEAALEENGYHQIRQSHSDFDFDAVARSLGELDETHDSIEIAGEALSKILAWAFNGCSVAVGVRKMCCACFILKPDLMNEANMVELAKELKVTKQMVTKNGLSFADHFGVQFRSQRSKAARESMRHSMRQSHSKRAAANVATARGNRA